MVFFNPVLSDGRAPQLRTEITRMTIQECNTVSMSDSSVADEISVYGDRKGPNDSRYCAEGGVYYTDNFIEHDGGGGGVGWPWGAVKLQPKTNTSLNVR